MKQETKKSEGTLIVINKVPNIIPITQDVSKGLTNISAKIEEDKKNLSENLEKLKKSEPIEIKSFLGIAKTSGVIKAIGKVYSDLREYAESSTTGFCSLSDNMSGVLKLIQLITAAEKDLYEIIDYQSVQSNELRSLIQEWCHENNIKDEDVEKLLKTSIQRAYTLRDRIENLRNDCNLKIGQTAGELENIKKRIKEFDNEFDEKSKALENQVETAIKDVKQRLKETSGALLYEQKESISGMEEAFKESLSQIQGRAESLEKSQEAFIADSKTREEKRSQEQKLAFTFFVDENTKRYQALKNQYEEHKEAIDNEFDEKSKAFEKQMETAIKDVEQKQKETSDAILQEQKESISGMEEAFKENLSQIQERAESLERLQEAFIADSKTQEEKRLQEQKQAFNSFVEENTKRYQAFKNQYEEHEEAIDKEFDEKGKALENQVETAIKNVEQKLKETSDALLQEQKENISGMENSFKENLSQIQDLAESLEKSQEAFIADSKTLEKRRVQEQKQAFTSFLEENTKLSHNLKRQVNIYKAISIGAVCVSIASLIYAIIT